MLCDPGAENHLTYVDLSSVTTSPYSNTPYNLTSHICRFIFSSWDIPLSRSGSHVQGGTTGRKPGQWPQRGLHYSFRKDSKFTLLTFHKSLFTRWEFINSKIIVRGYTDAHTDMQFRHAYPQGHAHTYSVTTHITPTQLTI